MALALLAGNGGGIAAAPGAAPRQEAAPEITVDPATDLVDGRQVTLRGRVVPADEVLLLAQCPTALLGGSGTDTCAGELRRGCEHRPRPPDR